MDARERRATNKTMFICHKCSYKAPSIAMLRKHEESDHEESVAYNCNQCNKTFKKKRLSINIKYQIMRKKNINVTYVMKSAMQQRDLSNIKGHVMKVENIHVITAIMRKQ